MVSLVGKNRQWFEAGRGLSFVAGRAAIGLSLPRENCTFSGLDHDE